MGNTQTKLAIQNKMFSTQFKIKVHINKFQCATNLKNTRQNISQHVAKFCAKCELKTRYATKLFSVQNKMLHPELLGIIWDIDIFPVLYLYIQEVTCNRVHSVYRLSIIRHCVLNILFWIASLVCVLHIGATVVFAVKCLECICVLEYDFAYM